MQKKIETIYKILMSNLSLTDSVLLYYGITKEDIKKLIEMNVIKSDNKGVYELTNIEGMRCYGVNLVLRGYKKEANLCFEKCYDLDKSNTNINIQYLLSSIKENNYKQVFKIFANLEKIQPETYITDSNLYLYLLSIIVDIPSEYYERVKQMTYDDFRLPRTDNNKLENEIRWNINRGKYLYAFQKICDLTRNLNSNGQNTTNIFISLELTKTLLLKVVKQERNFKSELLRLAKEKKYEKIICALEGVKINRGLDVLKENILTITKAIVCVSKENKIPNIEITQTLELQEALEGNNFILAKKINDNFIKKYNRDANEDIINILLTELNTLISKIEEQNSSEVIEQSTTIDVVILDSSQIEAVLKQTDLLEELLDAEAYVDYISSQKLTIDTARKEFGLNIEVVLMIKLAYVINCYGYRIKESQFIKTTEEKIKEANSILEEIELYENKTAKVLQTLNEVKSLINNPKKKILTK